MQMSEKICMNSRDNPVEWLLATYSDLFQMLRSVAWLSRLKNYSQTGTSKCLGQDLTLTPLKLIYKPRAEGGVIRVVQRQVYGKGWKALRKPKGEQGFSSHSVLLATAKLNPFLFNRFICVGGRLSYFNQYESLKYSLSFPNLNLSRAP